MKFYRFALNDFVHSVPKPLDFRDLIDELRYNFKWITTFTGISILQLF